MECASTPTGIGINKMKNESVKSEKYDDAIYDLQGRKIANSQQPKAKGLYIVDGKKVAVKWEKSQTCLSLSIRDKTEDIKQLIAQW